MEKILSEKGFKILVVILIVIILIITAISNMSKESVTVIKDNSELSEILKQEDVVIIDVRTENEYNESHIPRAINIPYDEIEDNVNYDKNMKIVVYSDNDSRSHLASVVLEKMGYTNIYESNMNDYKGELVTK